MATVGGNIVHPNAFNIIGLLVEILDGLVSVYDGKNKKRLTLSDYYKYRKGLITEILFPLKYNKDIFYFEKITKTQSSWEAYITFSFRARVKSRKIEDIRLVFGSINSLPVYNKELEDDIKNSVIDNKFIKYISRNILIIYLIFILLINIQIIEKRLFIIQLLNLSQNCQGDDYEKNS